MYHFTVSDRGSPGWTAQGRLIYGYPYASGKTTLLRPCILSGWEGTIARFHRPEKAGRDSPPMALLREDADRFLMVAHQNADHGPAILRLKRHAVADGKLQHRGVRPQLMKKQQAF